MHHALKIITATGGSAALITPTFVGLTTFSYTGSNHPTETVAPHTNTAQNDILLVIRVTVAASSTTPSNYTQLTNSPLAFPSGGVVARMHLYWKRAGASETGPAFTNNNATNDIIVASFRGCPETGNPWDVLGNDVSVDSLSATLTFPSVTTTVPGTMLVMCAGSAVNASRNFNDNAANAGLSSLALRGQSSTVGAGTRPEAGLYTGIKRSAGDTGTTSATLTGTAARAMYVVALKRA